MSFTPAQMAQMEQVRADHTAMGRAVGTLTLHEMDVAAHERNVATSAALDEGADGRRAEAVGRVAFQLAVARMSRNRVNRITTAALLRPLLATDDGISAVLGAFMLAEVAQ